MVGPGLLLALTLLGLSRARAETAVGLDARGVDPIAAVDNPMGLDVRDALGRLAVANHVPQKDAWRITLTWPVINHASSVFFLIGGADKAEVLKEVLMGPSDPERLPSQLIWPASGILTLILDKAAAALLPATDELGCGVLERER